MENISYGTYGSRILELHKPGRTDLLNLLSICISLFMKNIGIVTAPHTHSWVWDCSSFLYYSGTQNTCLKPRTAKAERCCLCPLLITNIEYKVIRPHSLQCSQPPHKQLKRNTSLLLSPQTQAKVEKPKPAGQLSKRAHLLDGKRETLLTWKPIISIYIYN